MYVWVILCPPVAVLMAGKPFQSVIAFFLWLLMWIPGSIYAYLIVKDYKADKRMEKQVKLQHKYNQASQ